MADKVTNLYNAFINNGYAMESEAQFRENLKDPKKRKAAYDALVSDGYNMEPYADFESNIGYAPKPQAAPTTAPQSQQQNTSEAPVSTPAPTQQTEQAPIQSAQQGWQPTEQDKIRMSYQMHTMLNDFNQKSRARLEQTRRMTEQFTPEGRKKLKAKKFQAQLAGTPTQVMGLTPPTPVPASQDATQDGEGATPQQPVRSGQSPVPYGVKYVDGKPVTEWMLPDGSLTTSLIEADQAEYSARTGRLRQQFDNRMKQNGLDPAKQEDVQRQAELDMISTIVSPMEREHVAESLWQEAEEKHKVDRDANADQAWSSYAAMGGGREMRVVSASMNRHADMVSHMTRFDLQNMMDNAWVRVGDQMTDQCYSILRRANPEASEPELRQSASEWARQLCDKQIYDFAVKKNTPKSTGGH